MITVTAGIIFKKDKFLIAKRKTGDHLAGYWEFPGGKIKPGESPEDCLVREIAEELGLSIHIQVHFTDCIYAYPEKTVCLKAYMAQYVTGEIVLNDHEEAAWIRPEQLDDYVFAPADVMIAEKIKGKRKEDGC
jgi:8-oxo-dGTP diphosphatase